MRFARIDAGANALPSAEDMCKIIVLLHAPSPRVIVLLAVAGRHLLSAAGYESSVDIRDTYLVPRTPYSISSDLITKLF